MEPLRAQESPKSIGQGGTRPEQTTEALHREASGHLPSEHVRTTIHGLHSLIQSSSADRCTAPRSPHHVMYLLFPPLFTFPPQMSDPYLFYAISSSKLRARNPIAFRAGPVHRNHILPTLAHSLRQRLKKHHWYRSCRAANSSSLIWGSPE